MNVDSVAVPPEVFQSTKLLICPGAGHLAKKQSPGRIQLAAASGRNIAYSDSFLRPAGRAYPVSVSSSWSQYCILGFIFATGWSHLPSVCLLQLVAKVNRRMQFPCDQLVAFQIRVCNIYLVEATVFWPDGATCVIS